MKGLARDMLYAVNLGFLLPTVVAFMILTVWRGEPGTVPEFTQIEETVTGPISLPVLVRDGKGKLQEMDMDDYLTGVLLAEMPADFETEALKAQAVAARTFSQKAWESGGKHTDGSVCTDSGCCQAYCAPGDFLKKGCTQEELDRVHRAVTDTSGQVLQYGGALIEATYYACSGGRTEDAAEVWGTDYPYLVAVDSPGEEGAQHYRDTVIMTREEFRNALELPENQLTIGNVQCTDGGGVDKMVIGGEAFTGTELRKRLGLASTAMELDIQKDRVMITTKGYGHRVGMSQYGADAMAAAGKNYREILEHYYPGTEIVCMKAE